MADGTHKVLVRNVPPRLKGKIARRVRDEDSNMNDVLVSILAGHYGVDYEPTGGRKREVGASPTIMLYVPTELRDAIDLDRQASGESIRNTVVAVISEAFGVTFKETGRWVGPKRRRRAAA